MQGEENQKLGKQFGFGAELVGDCVDERILEDKEGYGSNPARAVSRGLWLV